MTEGAPESCCGAGLGPSLVSLHVSVSSFSSHRAEQMSQLCVEPSPSSACTLTVTRLLPALPTSTHVLCCLCFFVVKLG